MYTVMPYRSGWRDEFVEIGKRLRNALGNLALRIDHIGSTAVPDLAAKDLVDVQITVESLTPAIEEALAQAGYKRLDHITHDHIPPGHSTDIAQWTKWFFRPSASEAAANTANANIHIRLQGRANQRYPLLFRDYLRAHPAIANAYGQVKLALITHQLNNPDAYYDVKDPVCDIIILGAEDWAATTKWEPGPSDC